MTNEELLLKYGSVIKQISKRFEGIDGVELDDLIQNASIALLKASKDYKNGDTTFKTYAISCIINSLRRYMAKYSKMIRCPESSFLKESIPVDSLDWLIEQDCSIIDRISDNKLGIELVHSEYNLEHLFKTLTDIEKEVIIGNLIDNYTLADLGLKIGKSKARIQQIRDKAIRKLRENIKFSDLDDLGK